MNKYSYVLVIISFILIMIADFVHPKLTYLGFAILVLGYFLPMIITKATGTQFKGN